MYHVIGSPATRAFRVLWTLEELGQPYDLTPAAPRSDAARAANPSGKVPALTVDGQTLTDSVAIMTYLADKHGALTHPAGTLKRALQDALTHAILDEMDAVLWTAARHTFVLPEDKRLPEVKDSLKWEFEASQKRFSDALEGPYLMGEEMTIADILLVHCLNWARAAGFPPADEKLKTYAKGLKARPAFQKVAAMAKG